MKKILGLLLALFLILTSGIAPADDVILLPEDVLTNQWFRDGKARLKTGNPTPLTGRFFTSLWGGTTSDLDVQDLLHAYSPILWDRDLGRFRFDRSVVEDALVSTNEAGDRVYLLALAEDLLWSDGTAITARDYSFPCCCRRPRRLRKQAGSLRTFPGWRDATNTCAVRRRR